MFVASVLVFAIITFFVSFLMGNIREVDKGKTAAYVSLIAWGSMIFGIFIMKLAP